MQLPRHPKVDIYALDRAWNEYHCAVFTLHCYSMEGRWNGELTSIPMHEEGSQVCSSDVLFRDDEGIYMVNDTLVEG